MFELIVVANSFITGRSSYLGPDGVRYVARKRDAKVFTSYDDATAMANAEQTKLGRAVLMGVRELAAF